MLPIPSSTNQEGCSPISSNCVIWQGCDLPCINLSRGDTVSDVISKLATELCDLLHQLDVEGFDLSCFDLTCVNLNNIHDLIQFILNQLCELKGCCGEGSGSSGNNARVATGQDCPDCVVVVNQAFWYTDPLGNQVNRMTLRDYAVAIGNKVGGLIIEINNIGIALVNQQNQIDYILTNYAPVPPITLPTFNSTCLTDKIPVVPPDGIPLVTMVNATQEAFCELRAATGFPSALVSSVGKECAALDTSPSLTYPGTNMASLPGWVNAGSYATVADALNNMWLTLCDLRTAVRGIQNTCCNTSCDDVSIMLQLNFTAPDQLSFYFSGSAVGFQDCVSGSNSGSFVKVTDVYGNFYNFYVPVIPNLNSTYNVSLSGTPLNLSTNLNVNVSLCVNSNGGLIVCERCIEQTVFITSPCQALTLDSTDTTVEYSINNTLADTVTFQVDLRVDGNPTIIDTYSSVQVGPGVVTNTFNTLTPSTVYTVTVTMIIGGVVTNVCPAGIISTTATP